MSSAQTPLVPDEAVAAAQAVVALDDDTTSQLLAAAAPTLVAAYLRQLALSLPNDSAEVQAAADVLDPPPPAQPQRNTAQPVP